MINEREKRYHQDHAFHAIVDVMRAYMKTHHMTPAELKDAVLFATLLELSTMMAPPAWMRSDEY